MATVVVDASALAAMLFGEPEGERVVSALEGKDLAAPRLLPFEIANVALVKLRRRSAPRSSLELGLESFEALSVGLHDVPAGHAFAVAAEARLSPYDASYLVLAIALGAELVTLDRELQRAFREMR